MKFFFHPQLTDTFCNFYDSKNLNEIKQYFEDLKKNKLRDIQSIMTTTSEIRENIQNLKTDVLNNFFNELSSTDNIHRKMFDIETKITRIIEAIREKFLLLSNIEKVLHNELVLTEQRIKSLFKPLNPKLLLPIKKSTTPNNSSEQNSRTEFREFLLSNGGHYGGWTHQDHFLFLKLRRKYSGKRFIEAVQFLLPDAKEDDIVDHEKWFKKYETYKNIHKNAIKKWKKEKQYQSEITLEKKSEKKFIVPPTKEIHHKNVALKICKWKEKQLIKNLDGEKKERQRIEKIESEKEEKKKEIQKNKKKVLSNYKTNKFNAIQEVIRSKSTIFPSKEKNGTLLNSFKLQDLKWSGKKAKTLKSVCNNKKSERLSKTNEKPRDLESVFKPTFVWNMHCRQKNDNNTSESFFYLNTIPRLGVPNWRKEFN